MQDMQTQWDVSLLLLEKIQKNRLFPREKLHKGFQTFMLYG